MGMLLHRTLVKQEKKKPVVEEKKEVKEPEKEFVAHRKKKEA